MPPDLQNDGTYVADVLAGRREQFGEIVRKYQGPLMRLAVSRLGRLDLAEDAVQETFLCAFKSLASYDSRFSFRTWLWTILLNQCRRHLRRGPASRRFAPGATMKHARATRLIPSP